MILKNSDVFKDKFKTYHFRIVYLKENGEYNLGASGPTIKSFMVEFASKEPIEDYEEDVPKFISLDDLLEKYSKSPRLKAYDYVAMYQNGVGEIGKKEIEKIKTK